MDGLMVGVQQPLSRSPGGLDVASYSVQLFLDVIGSRSLDALTAPCLCNCHPEDGILRKLKIQQIMPFPDFILGVDELLPFSYVTSPFWPPPTPTPDIFSNSYFAFHAFFVL